MSAKKDDIVEAVDEIVEAEDHIVHVDPVKEAPKKKSFDQVVEEVRRGEWGKGQARRLALSKAGYDHVAVQKEVIKQIRK